MSFRKEKKIRLSISDQIILKSKLKSQGMMEIYTPRIVNSIYFDTEHYKMYHESEEGIVPRKKVRIRWYNNDLNKQTLENKISSYEGRYKYSKDIMSSNNIKNINFLLDKSYGKIMRTLKIQYSREYFKFKNMRITFDSNIIYKNLRKSVQNYKKDFLCVVEIKTPINIDDDYINKHFNLSWSRFSKYARGVLILNEN